MQIFQQMHMWIIKFSSKCKYWLFRASEYSFNVTFISKRVHMLQLIAEQIKKGYSALQTAKGGEVEK